MLTGVDASLSADVQADGTYACSSGIDDMGRLGLFCLRIWTFVSRVSCRRMPLR